MNQISAASGATPSQGLQGVEGLLLEEGAQSEVCRNWGSLFAVFADAMEASAARLQAQVPVSEELMLEMRSASRRYGAMVEGLCMRGAKGPCLVYDLADGYSVIMVQQREITEDMLKDVEQAYEAEQCVIPEDTFTAFLAQAIGEFFSRHVEPGRIVTVQVGGCEYIITPVDRRDIVLRDLKIGTSADVF